MPSKKKAAKKAPVKAARKKAVPKKAALKKAPKKKAAPKKVPKKAATTKTAKKVAAKKVPTTAARAKPIAPPVSAGWVPPPVLAFPTGPVAAGPLPPFEAMGQGAGPFTLKVYRGEWMVLLAMNWANGQKPPANFVGFTIEYQEPGGTQFFALKNRLSFLQSDGSVNPNILSTRLSPIQKFRWAHFPFHPGLTGDYIYRVTPAFMDAAGTISYGDYQQASIQLQSETYPGQLNIAFTRGFVASQGFVDDFGTNGGVGTILPTVAANGLTFTPTSPKEDQALTWMGFEARQVILSALDQAIADTTAQIRVLAYDFNEPEIVDRLIKLGNRLRVIIDDSGTHKPKTSAESQAEAKLIVSAGADHVQRQHMGSLQHNKTIAIMGDKVNFANGGSTNFSWRGLFVQNNNAVALHGASPAKLFFDQFDNMWNNAGKPAAFGATPSAGWNNLGLPGINAKVSFSPHIASNARLAGIGTDIGNTTSSLLYSLAFLYETKGPVLDAIKKVTANNKLFVYGMSDKTVGGLNLQIPDGNPPIVFPAALLENVPQPFLAEATGGSGTRMHHKFVVIDFDKPTARVYTGSYNFSSPADLENGENLFLIQDRRIAVSYMIEAVVMFDHYEFRDAEAKSPTGRLYLQKPPSNAGDKPWWDEDYSNAAKARDRVLFSSVMAK